MNTVDNFIVCMMLCRKRTNLYTSNGVFGEAQTLRASCHRF